jgi:hypothetical protein
MVCSSLLDYDNGILLFVRHFHAMAKFAHRRVARELNAEIVWTNPVDGAIRKVAMAFSPRISRRTFMQSTSLAAAGAATYHLGFPPAFAPPAGPRPLEEFGYGDVTLTSDLHEKQLRETHSVLMELSEDSLLKPFRQMAGQPAPGADLGGWYHYDPDYDPNTVDVGFAPAATFGQ